MKRGQEIRTVETHNLIGERQQVANVLHAAAARGDLVGRPVPRLLRDGRVAVTVRLISRPATRRRRKVRRSTVAAVAGITAAVAAAAWLTVWAVGQAIAWLLDHLAVIVGVLGLVLFVIGALARSGAACRGLHCPGCRH